MLDHEGGVVPPRSKSRLLFAAFTVGAASFSSGTMAGSFDLGGANVDYQLIGTYAAAVRLEDPNNGIINTAPGPRIPLPDYLKLPESNNYDDGDRNFKKGALVNNRLSFLGELLLTKDDYGILIRGDVFYDDVYRHSNDNNSPDTINKTTTPVNEFSASARYRDGRRARLLDAYAFGTWNITDEMVLNLRVGRHIAAWGESLFFSGVALAQAPADATKATLPGADVKSILLPVNQISASMSLTDKMTILGQYKLEFAPVELNPVGEFFSVADVVGPGAEFIYGIDNPLYLSNLTDVNLVGDDVPEAIDLIRRLAAAGLPTGPVTDALGGILANLDPLLPDVNLPDLNLIQPAGTPKYINVQRLVDTRPSPYGQWGLGIKYQLTSNTNLGFYRLRYHNTTPAPVQNYGYALLLPGNGLTPAVTTAAFGLQVPVTYSVHYFDGIKMTAGSFSTILFGVNVAGELIYRDGVDVLVDVFGSLLGPVPTPTRAKVSQALLSGLYVTGPGLFWDSVAIVGETGYVHVNKVEESCGPETCSTDLTYSRDAAGYQFLFIFETKNVFSGWDLQIPVGTAGVIDGQSSLLAGLGSLMGPGDYRASIGVNFTRLQKLQLGLSYNGFLGEANFKSRPYADRDYAGFTVRYNF